MALSELNPNSHNECNGLSSSNFVRKDSFSLKVFCDPVHGQIALHPACVAIIDTPQFQRLRDIKQTGSLEYVYPGATHNRFTHSLGVCYLAEKFIQELRERQRELMITDVDILCVALAGLCHDLGHGPLSHTWERFMNTASKLKKPGYVWKHEIVSTNMIDYLIEENNLYPILKRYGIGPEEIKLVKNYILGAKPSDPRRAFLYQIVNNDDSGLDVDKWDYFLRDCHYLGLPRSFEYERLIQCARVLLVNGRTQICFRDKALESVYNVFRTRSNLHRLAYQHKVMIIIEKMLIEALISADGKCVGPKGEILEFFEWSVSAAESSGEELKKALENYCSLTDNLLFIMKFSPHPSMQRSVNIIQAIERRSYKEYGFYQHVGMKILPHYISEKEIHNRLCSFLSAANKNFLKVAMNSSKENLNPEISNPVNPEDICVCVVSINWGKKDKNPVNFVHFYSKNSILSNHTGNYFDVSALLPKSFEEIQAHVLCHRNDIYAVEVVQWCFEKMFNYLYTNGNDTNEI